MAQHSWNITGTRGNTFNLGLFHGAETGHVVLHCNNKVVAIDFGVRDEKKYSLFLDQELCEVTIQPLGKDGFDYDCRINHEVETPLNAERKRHRDEENRVDKLRVFAAAFVGLLVVILLIASAS